MYRDKYMFTIDGVEVEEEKYDTFQGPGIARLFKYNNGIKHTVRETYYKARNLGFEVRYDNGETQDEIREVWFITPRHGMCWVSVGLKELMEHNERLGLLVKYGIVMNDELMALLEQDIQFEAQIEKLRWERERLNDKIGKMFAQSNGEEHDA